MTEPPTTHEDLPVGRQKWLRNLLRRLREPRTPALPVAPSTLSEPRKGDEPLVEEPFLPFLNVMREPLLPTQVLTGGGALAADHGTGPSWTVRATSVVGSWHASRGMPRQDAYGLLRLDDQDLLVLGVADGLGSTPRADVAAQQALYGALESLRVEVPRTRGAFDMPALLTQAVADAAEAVLRLGGQHERRPATTLTLVAVDLADSRLLHMANVGDSRALRLRGAWAFLTADPEDVSAGGVTQALPHDAQRVITATSSWQPGDAVLLATDGLLDSLGGLRARPDPDLHEEWAQVPPFDRFVSEVAAPVRGCSDDRTALVAWLSQAAELL